MGRAVEVRLEDDSTLGDLTQPAQAEDLKTAGIGEKRVGPGHEAMQSAELPDQLVAGAEEQVVGVGENDRRAEFLGEVALGESFDGGLSPDGHEHGSFDVAVSGVKYARAGAGLGALGDYFEGNLAQGLIVSRAGSGNCCSDVGRFVIGWTGELTRISTAGFARVVIQIEAGALDGRGPDE